MNAEDPSQKALTQLVNLQHSYFEFLFEQSHSDLRDNLKIHEK
jgi:hypothetical protein